VDYFITLFISSDGRYNVNTPTSPPRRDASSSPASNDGKNELVSCDTTTLGDAMVSVEVQTTLETASVEVQVGEGSLAPRIQVCPTCAQHALVKEPVVGESEKKKVSAAEPSVPVAEPEPAPMPDSAVEVVSTNQQTNEQSELRTHYFGSIVQMIIELDYGYEDDRFFLCVHFVTMLNPVFLLSRSIYFWENLEASKWSYCCQVKSSYRTILHPTEVEFWSLLTGFSGCNTEVISCVSGQLHNSDHWYLLTGRHDLSVDT
jgi:hypothetical protein